MTEKPEVDNIVSFQKPDITYKANRILLDNLGEFRLYRSQPIKGSNKGVEYICVQVGFLCHKVELDLDDTGSCITFGNISTYDMTGTTALIIGQDRPIHLLSSSNQPISILDNRINELTGFLVKRMFSKHISQFSDSPDHVLQYTSMKD